MVVRAVDLAYVRRGHTPSDGARPPLFVLGAESAVLLMRFDVVVQPGVKLVEAYVILRRAFADSDTHESLLLHPTRIVEAWDGRSTAWASRPRVVEGSAPTTLVHPNHPSLVRLDVLDLVREWPRLDGRDHGLAVVAENEPRGGMAFAFGVPSAGFLSSSAEASPDPDGVMADGVMDPDIESEPALELYFR